MHSPPRSLQDDARQDRRQSLGICYSYRQFCALGPLPPHTPARPDAQVPKDSTLGPCRHGKIGAFYFYKNGSKDEPAFGFFDIELSVQSLSSGKVRIELYVTADGYQSSRGTGRNHPLRIALMHDEKMLGSVAWAFPDVICGHADPMSFSTDIDLEVDAFAGVNRIDLLAVEGLSSPCI
jgi:hypothetical protein